MRPVTFPEANKIWAEDQPQYDPLPSFTDERETISRWRLTLRERVAVLWHGAVWIRVCNFGRPLQPQLLQVERPFVPPPTMAYTPHRPTRWWRPWLGTLAAERPSALMTQERRRHSGPALKTVVEGHAPEPPLPGGGAARVTANAGWLPVSLDLVRAGLNLPPEISIVGIELVDQFTCRILLEGPGLPLVGNGESAPEVICTVHHAAASYTFERWPGKQTALPAPDASPLAQDSDV